MRISRDVSTEAAAITASAPAARLNAALGAVWRRLIEPVLVLMGQGLQSAASFLVGILLARFASIAALGDYTLGMSVWFLTASLAETLIATPFTYAVVARASSRQQQAVFQAALAATVGLAVVSGVIVGVAGLVSPALAPLFPPLPVAMTLALARELIRRRHYAHAEPGRALKSDIITIVTQFAIMAWVIRQGRLDAEATFWAVGCGCGLAVGVGLFELRSPVHLSLRTFLLHCRRFSSFGRWLAMGGVCQILSLQSFSWFLYLTSDTSTTGAFSACVAISSLPNPFLVGMTNYARPALIRVYRADGWRGLATRTMQLAGVFVVPVCVFVVAAILFGGKALGLLYGQGLLWAQGSLVWTSVALLAIAGGAPIQLALLAINKPLAVLYLHVGELAATYLIGLPLVIAIGLYGAAIGYFAAAAAGFAVLLWFFLRERRRRTEAGAT